MSNSKQLENELSKVLDTLPRDKAIELIDFARFLANKYSRAVNTQIDTGSLHLQQKSLSKIWDSSEEDIYEL